MIFVKKDEATAANRTLTFRMVDSSGAGVDTLTTPVVKIKKNGAGSYATIVSPTITTCGDSTYEVEIPAANIDTYGPAMVMISAANAVTQFLPICVTAFDPYDADALGSGLSQFDHTADDVTGTLSGDVELSATGLDSVVVETGVSALQALRLILAALLGECSGGSGTEVQFKKAASNAGISAPSSGNRIRAQVDVYGNRTAVRFDTSA